MELNDADTDCPLHLQKLLCSADSGGKRSGGRQTKPCVLRANTTRLRTVHGGAERSGPSRRQNHRQCTFWALLAKKSSTVACKPGSHWRALCRHQRQGQAPVRLLANCAETYCVAEIIAYMVDLDVQAKRFNDGAGSNDGALQCCSVE